VRLGIRRTKPRLTEGGALNQTEDETLRHNIEGCGVALAPLGPNDRPSFMRDVQEAFMTGVREQLPMTPDEGPIPADADIAASLETPGGVAFHILLDGQRVGGAVLEIDTATHRNSLAFFFVRPGVHGRGIGQQAWKLIEERFPETLSWETHTPYFEKRNIHFYVNKCGFKIVEFFHERHPDPHDAHAGGESFEDGMFRFEKSMRATA
jgi:GNAT superfamily N-acetyltransferase